MLPPRSRSLNQAQHRKSQGLGAFAAHLPSRCSFLCRRKERALAKSALILARSEVSEFVALTDVNIVSVFMRLW